MSSTARTSSSWRLRLRQVSLQAARRRVPAGCCVLALSIMLCAGCLVVGVKHTATQLLRHLSLREVEWFFSTHGSRPLQAVSVSLLMTR